MKRFGQVSVSNARAIIVLGSDENADQVVFLFSITVGNFFEVLLIALG